MNKNSRDIPFIFIFVAFGMFWPLGLVLFLAKFGILDSILSIFKKDDGISSEELRYQKYKIVLSGRNSETIGHLASVVGVYPQVCIKDLQYLISRGDFGPDAYINYLENTIVLKRGADAGQKYDPVDTAGYEKVSKSKSGKKKASSKKNDADPYKSLNKMSGWLLALGIIFGVVGFINVAEAFDTLVWLGFDSYFIQELMGGLFWLAGGVVSLVTRSSAKKRIKRMKAYTAVLAGKDYIELKELASVAGVNIKTVKKDMEYMIDKGLLGKEAYIDQGDELLILKAGAGPEPETATEPAADDEDSYMAILKEIRQVNDDIPDPEISARIDQIEKLTAAIFKSVKDNPKKLPQIRSFMSYYLPTTLKLLHSYAEFDKAGASGSNISSAKADIEGILSTLVEGFKKQLDKLYEADAIDISSDIDVLENMLRRDGLSQDDSGFGGVAAQKK